MSDHEPAIAPGSLSRGRRRSGIARRAVQWLCRIVLLPLLGFAAYVWTAASLYMVRFDYTGLDRGAGSWPQPPPIDYGATLFCCLGPPGWIVGLGVFGFALAMALTVYRFRWPVRVIVAATPGVLIIYQVAHIRDLYPWVRQAFLRILPAETLLAVLAALLCRPIWRLLVRASCGDALGGAGPRLLDLPSCLPGTGECPADVRR